MDRDAKGFSCYWRIENFIYFKKNTDITLSSPVFRACSLSSYFCLNIQEKQQNYLGIYLAKVPKPSEFHRYCQYSVSINYSISLLTNAGWISVVNNEKHKFEADSSSWGVDKVLDFQNLERKAWEYLPSGCLTVKFHMWNENTRNSSDQCLIISRMLSEKEVEHLPVETYYTLEPSDLMCFPSSYQFEKDIKVSKETQTSPSNENTSSNNEDIVKLFQEENLCFVILKTSEKQFVVNKSVLSAMSRVFRSLFEKEAEKGAINYLNIDDIDNETLTSVIHLVHLEPLEDLDWDKAVRLFNAVDKYEIEFLKKSCISLLVKTLSERNIFEAFILADKHQEMDLKHSALIYFIRNSKTILRSLEWKNFLLNHTQLAADILHNSVDESHEV